VLGVGGGILLIISIYSLWPRKIVSLRLMDNIYQMQISSPLLKLATFYAPHLCSFQKWFIIKELSSKDLSVFKSVPEKFFIQTFEDLRLLKPTLYIGENKLTFRKLEEFFEDNQENIWTYKLERVKKIASPTYKELNIKNSKYRIVRDGLLLLENGEISFSFRVSDNSLIEVEIVSSCKYSSRVKNFDSSAEYVVSIDGIQRYKTQVLRKNIYQQDKFRMLIIPGEHTLSLKFNNAYNDPLKKLRRTLLIRAINIYKLSNIVYIKSANFPSGVILKYFSISSLRDESELFLYVVDKFWNGEVRYDISIEDLIGLVDINGEIYNALFAPPPTKVIKEIKIPAGGAYFSFKYGILPNCWNKPGDGVTFKVTAITQRGGEFVLFERYINPKKNLKDRRWFSETLNLTKFRNQKIKLIIETLGSSKLSLSIGPPDNSYDYAVLSS